MAFRGEEGALDLSSRAVYVTTGTISYDYKHTCHPGRVQKVKNVDDHKDIFDALVTEQPTKSPNLAILHDTILAGALSHFEGLTSSKWKIHACQSALEQYGIAFRKGHPKFRRELEVAWEQLKEENKICELYNLWFREPKIKPLMEKLYNSEDRATTSKDLYKLCNSP